MSAACTFRPVTASATAWSRPVSSTDRPPPSSAHSSGTRHSRTPTPTTQARPPDHTANSGPPMAAAETMARNASNSSAK